nr:MAG TPA: hypothetical protein [Bacteriophage sp.]
MFVILPFLCTSEILHSPLLPLFWRFLGTDPHFYII